MKKISTIALFTLLLLPTQTKAITAPKLTVIVVVDQLSKDYINRYSKNFKGGIARLLNEGIVYNQALYPSGMPATATNHAEISTGTLACNNGIIANYWYDKTGTKKIDSDKGDWPNDAVFGIDEKEKKAISSKKLLVDSLADQIMFSDNNHEKTIYSFSLKSRAATVVAGKKGKCFWYDSELGRMTSSKAYMEGLPFWIEKFNNSNPIAKQHPISWRLSYPSHSQKYKVDFAQNDEFAVFGLQLLPRNIVLIPKDEKNKEKWNAPHKWIELTPQSSKYLFDCAKECIRQELPYHKQMVVWISLSNLDKLGHRLGPNNIATIDLLYHIDKQLGSFIKFTHKYAKPEETLFVLTGDHGTMPIPEILAKKGYPAKRINSDQLITQLNEKIEQKFWVKNLIKKYKSPQFFLDENLLQAQPIEKQKRILQEIISYLKSTPGIKTAWTFDELKQGSYPVHSIASHYKSQLYPGRSGQIIIQPHPYCMVTNYPLGTGHMSPYRYDTCVPLVLHKPGSLEKKKIEKRVWMPQLTTTLATLLGIAKPSAASFEGLPEIF